MGGRNRGVNLADVKVTRTLQVHSHPARPSTLRRQGSIDKYVMSPIHPLLFITQTSLVACEKNLLFFLSLTLYLSYSLPF